MAQVYALSEEHVTYVQAESTFCTHPGAPLTRRLHCIKDDLISDGMTQEMLENPDERQIRWDDPPRIAGLQTGSKFGPVRFQAKHITAAGKLAAGGAAVAYSQRVPLLHGFGTEHAELGTAIGMGSTTTNIVVTSTANHHVGEMMAFKTGVGVYEPAIIHEVVDGTHFELEQGLSAAPGADADGVRGMYGYYFLESQTDSLVVERKYTHASGLEYRWLGCQGGLKLELPEYGKIPVWSLDGEAAFHEGPTTLAAAAFGVSTPAADDMGLPIVWHPVCWIAAWTSPMSTMLRQPAAPGYTPPTRVEKLAVSWGSEWQAWHDGSKPTSGYVGGRKKVGGRPSPATITATIIIDPSQRTYFELQNTYNIMVVNTVSERLFCINAPCAQLVSIPKTTKQGKLLAMELVFTCLRGTYAHQAAAPTVEEASIAQSPIVIGMG